MFTGLVADKGRVININRSSESALVEIESALVAELQQGDSISVNGVCLTAIRLSKSTFMADVMIQTLRITSLSKLEVGQSVNLELATRASDRLGGHIVQGHVDSVGEVLANEPGERWNRMQLRIPANLSQYIVNQGSIAIEGVSLTVGEINGTELTLWLIPETLAKTNLAEKKVGDPVNIEVDVIAKYVERLMKGNNE
jgi:riboflavin synthase